MQFAKELVTNSNHRILHIGTLQGGKLNSFLFPLSLLALLVSAGCGGGSTSAVNSNNGGGGGGPATLRGTIAAGTAPVAVAVDPASNKIFVVDFGTRPTLVGNACSPSGADVMVIDGASQTSTSIGFWTSLSSLNPLALALSPGNHAVYVLAQQYWSGLKGTSCGPFVRGLEVLDPTILSQTKNIVGGYTSGLDVNGTTDTIYLAWVANQVAVMDGTSYAVIATISVGTNPAGVAVNATTNKVYVANSGSNDVSVIDGATNSVVTTIADPNAVAPVAVAVNATTNTIYVANSNSNNLTVIDGATGSVTATITVGTSPSGVAVDTQRNVIYVANAGSSQTGNQGNVTIIDGATNATTTLSDPKAVNPVAVAVDSATNKIYVANSGSNNVTVIDGAH